MRALVNTAPGRLELRELPLPEPGASQVRIRTAACGICATDLQMIAGWERTGFPAIPGHEWAGVVDAVGAGVSEGLCGAPCVAENVLEDGGEVGFEHPGGYASFFLTRAANVQLLPPALPLPLAVLIEPLAVCVRALRRLRLEDRRAALVLGDGPIGLLLLRLLRRAGVERLALVGGRPARLRLAAEATGAETLNYHEAGPDLGAALRARWPEPFPNVLEASGSAAALECALHAAAKGGKVLVIGDYGAARAGFPWNHLLHRELELIGSNASAEAWPEAVRLATEEVPFLARLVTHRVPVAQYAAAFDTVRRDRDALKVVLLW
jgi:2-desacetyl-2-hydroxyethyl bacteriochlorophyllide A dehydrogenase